MSGRKNQKSNKEERMKKIVVIMLALCLAVPAISHAGAVTSRWDLNVGGNIKFDTGWLDYNASNVTAGGLPARVAIPEAQSTKYGQQIWGMHQTGLNFAVRGPDAWGAKTSAFFSGDFISFFGGEAAPPGTGGFGLMLAQMTFDWPNTSLLIGQVGPIFGYYPTWTESIGWSSLGWGGKGAAPVMPQFTVTQKVGPNFRVMFGIASGDQFVQKGGAFSKIENLRADIPVFQGGVNWSSDACGKIGPWMLNFGVDAAWGQNKYVKEVSNTGSEKDVDKWWAEVKWLVPIIPEKNGNKAGALYYGGQLWTAQNMGDFYGGGGNAQVGAYQRADGDYKAAVVAGTFNHVAYYITDSVSINAMYYYLHAKNSRKFASGNLSAVDYTYGYLANLAYWVNPAIKFVFQWNQESSRFIADSPAYKKRASHNDYRFSAMYYF